jgi:SAM-dependent methyltransferase
MPPSLYLLTAALSITIAIVAFVFNNSIRQPRIGTSIGQKHYFVDANSWSINTKEESLLNAAKNLSTTFSQSSKDEALSIFLEASAAATQTSIGRLKVYFKEQMFWSLQKYLGWSRTDASGFLSKASLYVASENQFQELLTPSIRRKTVSLLDIGSGTGTETSKVRNVLGIPSKDVTCLENSESMHKKLSFYGFQVSNSFDDLSTTKKFSHASLLNVLDRCNAPHELLQSTIHALENNGILLIATVIPFSGRVYVGKRGTRWGRVHSRKPSSPFDVRKVPTGIEATFERRLTMFLEAIQRHHPRLQLLKWTKLPYVSSGDTHYTHYTIDMALLVFQKQEPGIASSSANSVVVPLPKKCLNKGSDTIFNWLATTMVDHSKNGNWGNVLDAGAGFNSMCWLLRQEYDTITAVTATTEGRYGSSDLTQSLSNHKNQVKIVLGNWQQNDFFSKSKQFDVVVADYLLGATERHWSFGADAMMDRLLERLLPGGYLLLVGLEPYETTLNRDIRDDRIVLDIESIGDTAAVLAGASTYRELPMSWVRYQIERRVGEYQIIGTKQFEMTLTENSLKLQLRYAKQMAEKIKDTQLRTSYLKRIRSLEAELNGWTNHRGGRNYAMVVQRAKRKGL